MLLAFSYHSFLKNFAQEIKSKVQFVNVMARVQKFIFKHLLDYWMFYSIWGIIFFESILYNDGGAPYLHVAFLANHIMQ